MHRRDFLILAGLSPAALARAAAVPPRSKPPFRVLYSNDTTNITSCVSPYHPARADITDAMLRASIDEAAGADVQMLQPGMGWIPWWKSREYPAPDHYRYYLEKYGSKPNTFGKYMLAGGDLVKTFTEHCRARGRTAFVSLRLNDGHGLESVGTAKGQHTVSRFYEDNYLKWRIGPNQADWNDHVLNWAVPEVRAHKLAFIRELCEGYDLDGFELDFMRHPAYFNPDRTPAPERRRIMCAFVREVRALLDRPVRSASFSSSPQSSRRRWLCARIPALLEPHDRLGLDVAEWAAAGVDMFNLSCSYFTVQQTDLREIRRRAPDAALYLEMTHSVLNGPKLSSGYDSFPFLRTTPQQFATTARLACEQGADGVSLFNFVYTREHGGPGRGPFNEPPFELLGRLGDRAWLARQPAWHFMSAAPNNKILTTRWPLPRILKPGQTAQFTLELLGGLNGLLRLRAEAPLNNCAWQATLNGAPLAPAPFTAKPLPHPYDAWLGEPGQFACFQAPLATLKTGENIIEVRLLKGRPVKLVYLDLT